MGIKQTYTVDDALNELGITNYTMTDEPSTEAQFKKYFRKVTGTDESGSAILSDNTDDFGVTWSQIKTKMTELNSAKKYRLQRQYPSIEDQLDMQYHDAVDGTTTWKDAIAKVKSDNPKPE